MDTPRTQDPNPAPAAEVSREIAATPQTVWSIISDPVGVSAWMEGDITFDPRPGSPFRAGFLNHDIVIAGEVRSADPRTRRLAITWGIESGPQAEEYPAGSSLVEIRVGADGPGSRVDLRHTGLPGEETARQQEGGWRFHLSRLDLMANRIDLGAGLERTLPRWAAAWNELEAETRIGILRQACGKNVEFRDDWTAVRGVDLLNVHIGNCHHYMPGYALEHTGDIRICRGEALVGWRAIGPGGRPMEGTNHIRADPDGTIRRVTGFQAI